MTTVDNLGEFQKMWAWLSAHPAHDQGYYMRHVRKLDIAWPHGCPLRDQTMDNPCSPCQRLWTAGGQDLCSDTNSPLSRWRQTAVDSPDQRTWYANRLALLAMAARKKQADDE
ncbi:MAG: hypothetical protein ACK5PS_03950 [Desulfopila sp.]